MVKRKYKLLNETLILTFVDRVENEDGDWIYGKVVRSASTSEILISTIDENGKPLSEDALDLTVRHELFHFILDTLYFGTESGNETLIEWLAQATAVLSKQGLNI